VTKAFADSRNIPALRLAARVGIHNVIDTAHRFGVTSDIPPYLPIALGAVGITLQQQVASYAVFPNDGLRVAPRLIRHVQNADGITLWQDPSAVRQVINEKTARTMMTLLEAVIHSGTAASAAALNHPLGGKTGTTSDFTNAWFIGFSPSVTCGVWVGYDDNKSLGNHETGARAALPIWTAFMRAAIANHPDEYFLGEEPGSQTQQAAKAANEALAPHSPAVRAALDGQISPQRKRASSPGPQPRNSGTARQVRLR
jgi:penicillin-binding protein 1A